MSVLVLSRLVASSYTEDTFGVVQKVSSILLTELFKGCGGAFHLAKIFDLKLRNFSMSKRKAFSMRAKSLVLSSRLAVSLVDQNGRFKINISRHFSAELV